MKKHDLRTGISNSEYESDDISRSSHSNENKIELLSEMFPNVPVYLFYPLTRLNETEIGNSIIYLTELKDETDVKAYLSSLSNQSENTVESTSISGISECSVDEISSNDDDKVLADLENENEKYLVLGRTFIKEAHKMFSSQFGLENVSIDDIPPEITEMRLKVSDKLMLALYKEFFEEIGFIETNNNEQKQIVEEPAEKLTMKEIMDIETAVYISTEEQRRTISESESLSLQLSSLELKYPEISRDELQRVFIDCGMDTSLTIQNLSKSGYSPQKLGGNGSQKLNTKLSTTTVTNNTTTVTRNAGNNKKDVVTNALLAQRFQKRIDIENNRIQHAQNKLSLLKRHDLHAQVAHYWNEELANCRYRLVWYEEQLALVTEAQQSVIFDSRQLDLHGFTQLSAVAAVNQRIDKFRSGNIDLAKGNCLTIICGRGLHSLNGRSRLKPAIRQYLHHSGIVFTECFGGTFRVPLRQFLTRK